MNKIDITSDLHLDFWIDPQNNQKKQEKMMRRLISCLLPDEPSNVLVIAGDTGHYNWQNVMFIKLLKETYNHICIVFGNHDLYLVSDKMKKKFGGNSYNRLKDFIEQLDKIEGVHYLEGDMVEVDGLTIGGHGMWYDAGYAINEWRYSERRVKDLWQVYMNDSNLIRVPNEDGQLDYLDFIAESKKAKETLYDIFDLSDVILTHINPDWSHVPPHYNTPGTTFYHFDGRDILGRGGVGKTWVFGHTHDSILDMHRQGCVFATSPLGYPSNSIGSAQWNVLCGDLSGNKITFPESRRFRTMVVGDLPDYESVFDQLEEENGKEK